MWADKIAQGVDAFSVSAGGKVSIIVLKEVGVKEVSVGSDGQVIG